MGFIFWGVFVVYGIFLIAYLIWMLSVEKGKEE